MACKQIQVQKTHKFWVSAPVKGGGPGSFGGFLEISQKQREKAAFLVYTPVI